MYLQLTSLGHGFLFRNKPDQASARSIEPDSLVSSGVTVHLVSGRSAQGDKIVTSACEAVLFYLIQVAAIAETGTDNPCRL